jgi:hypothetical protein
MKPQSEKQIAINANYYLIEKLIKKFDLDEINSHFFILSAAKWCYRQYGFGTVNLDSYMEYLSNKMKIRLYNVDVKLWYKLRYEVFSRDNFTCQYCFSVGGKLECDHVIPISKGGTNNMDNLITSCRKCNRQKKDKSVAEFLQWKDNK